MHLRLRGLVAAPHTPMHADGSLWLEQVPTLVDRLLGDGIDGLYVLGSTGEGPSLTVDERRTAAAVFVEAAGGRVPVVVQVGHQSVAEARGLATHAASVGADAISAVLPSYYPFPGLEAVVRCIESIAAAAPETPFYYYSIPALSGVRVDVVELIAATVERVPSLAGVKYTAPTLHEFQACVETFGARIDVLYGCDEMLLYGMMAGAHGAVGSTYCFAAPLYRRVLAALDSGNLDVARREQARAVEMVRVLVRHGGNTAIKAMMTLCGTDCGPVRLPQIPLDDDAIQALRSDLDAIGFFTWGPSPAPS